MVSAGPPLAAALPASHSNPPALVNFVGAAIVKTEVFTNLGLALGAVFVVVLVVLANPLIAIIVLLNVAFCLLEVVGFMPLWDVTLDGVSVVNLVSHCRCCGTYPLDASRYSAVSLFRCFPVSLWLLQVLAIGLSVDYSIHIAHAFMHKQGTRKQRVTKSLGEMGVSVINGAWFSPSSRSNFLIAIFLFFLLLCFLFLCCGHCIFSFVAGAVSTFLAVVVLSGSKSYIFEVCTHACLIP